MNVEVSLHIQNWKARFIEAGFFVVHQPTPPSTSLRVRRDRPVSVPQATSDEVDCSSYSVAFPSDEPLFGVQVWGALFEYRISLL